MAPFDLSSMVGSLPYYLIFLMLGAAFGAVLEMSGFGDSRKLAAQFYLKDLTVLKVMFTAIVVACVLIFTSSALGLLEFSKVWVNPTYLLPGIIGGLIMGVGFIIGGFCPGTSVVAASTLKLDGVAFVGGVGLGTLLFSETASLLGSAKHATFLGRFTLDELFDISLGRAVVLLILMALIMFWAAELAEQHFGRNEKITTASLIPKSRFKIAAAATLFLSSVFVAILGQPDSLDKWKDIAERSGISLKNRDPYVHPAEVVEWRAENSVYVRVLDIRSEGDYNKFHLHGAINVSLASIENDDYVKALKTVPDNTLTFVVSNTESTSTAAWKRLVGAGVKNTYIIEGGINNWLTLYPTDPCVSSPIAGRKLGKEELAFSFNKSVGDNCYAAHPEAKYKEPPTDCYLEAHPEIKNNIRTVSRPVPFKADRKIEFKRKVKMQKGAKLAGGCG